MTQPISSDSNTTFDLLPADGEIHRLIFGHLIEQKICDL
jgi:hypothetical protein